MGNGEEEDWDAEGGNNPSENGISMGMGRGRGRGYAKVTVGESNGGFSLGRGITESSKEISTCGSGENYGWNDKPAAADCGWVSDWKDDSGNDAERVPRAGGFNKRDGGGGVCYTCQEPGHLSRDCPRKGNGGRGKGCFKCGDQSHVSRDCTSSGSGRGSGDCGRLCYNCGEDGHLSRECPHPKSDQNRGDGKSCRGDGDRKSSPGTCFKCNKEGHLARDCTEVQLDENGKPREAPYIPVDYTNDDNNLFDGISSGINFDKYEDIKVNFSEKHKIPPIKSFEEAPIRDYIKQNIKRARYIKPTPIQKYCIPIILAKRDLMACAQTGSGKTAAFMIPIISELLANDPESTSFKDVQEPLALILSPTRELAIQIYTEAKKFSSGSVLKSVVIYGGTSTAHQKRQVKEGCHVLVATPGRLLDFVEKGEISFGKLKFLVLDEADRMLDMGFVTNIKTVAEHSTTPNKEQRQTLMFSATFAPEVQQMAREFLKDDYLFVAVGEVGSANMDVQQTMLQVDKKAKQTELYKILDEAARTGEKVLVFVQTKRTADFLACQMSQKDYPATSIHGDRFQREREEALRDFKTGKRKVLIATAVAARGLDIKEVACVVNYDLPSTIDEYVHRIGRTGRVGNTGTAISFYDSTYDNALAGPLIKVLADALQEVPDWLTNEGGTGYGGAIGGRGFGGHDIRNEYEKGGSSSVPTNAEDIWE